jgi:hypothetical protein
MLEADIFKENKGGILLNVLCFLSASCMLRPSSMKVFEAASPCEASAGSKGVA